MGKKRWDEEKKKKRRGIKIKETRDQHNFPVAKESERETHSNDVNYLVLLCWSVVLKKSRAALRSYLIWLDMPIIAIRL